MPSKKPSLARGKTPKVRKSPKALPEEKQPTKLPLPGGAGIRIRLSAFDHHVLDEAAAKILDTAERSGAVVHGPLPLPTRIRKFTVNKSTFVHKNARDQYEMRTHRRLIDLTETTFKTVESLQSLSLPSGVDIEIQMK
ncbi:30S ribosomal protein S10 [Candidatus Peregrinibacteria bacterium]|nr:30S ribosomal protein S10 [Candidatus Peregrinibacteria bacterium]MBI2524170.1 30S ribosomal protein S10 [Candidatus Peregrinibacteria bacterium]